MGASSPHGWFGLSRSEASVGGSYPRAGDDPSDAWLASRPLLGSIVITVMVACALQLTHVIELDRCGRCHLCGRRALLRQRDLVPADLGPLGCPGLSRAGLAPDGQPALSLGLAGILPAHERALAGGAGSERGHVDRTLSDDLAFIVQLPPADQPAGVAEVQHALELDRAGIGVDARQADNVAVITIEGGIDMYTEVSVRRRLETAEAAGADADAVETAGTLDDHCGLAGVLEPLLGTAGVGEVTEGADGVLTDPNDTDTDDDRGG